MMNQIEENPGVEFFVLILVSIPALDNISLILNRMNKKETKGGEPIQSQIPSWYKLY